MLDNNDNADLSVYAVWLPMLPGDRRSAWKYELLRDTRVTHFWDAGAKAVGSWFRDHVVELKRSDAPGNDQMRGAIGNKRAAWDVYFLYGRDAKWAETPTPIVSWGRPVFQTEEQLRQDFRQLLNDR